MRTPRSDKYIPLGSKPYYSHRSRKNFAPTPFWCNSLVNLEQGYILRKDPGSHSLARIDRYPGSKLDRKQGKCSSSNRYSTFSGTYFLTSDVSCALSCSLLIKILKKRKYWHIKSLILGDSNFKSPGSYNPSFILIKVLVSLWAIIHFFSMYKWMFYF